MTPLIRILLGFLLVSTAVPLARAGHYEADTTSGLSPAYDPANGHAGVTYGNGSASGGGGSSNGGVSVSGTLTTVFHWVRDDVADDPPASAIVVETCDASADAKWYGYSGTPSAIAQNGLPASFSTNVSGVSPMPGTPPGKRASASSVGTAPKVVGGAETITVSGLLS